MYSPTPSIKNRQMDDQSYHHHHGRHTWLYSQTIIWSTRNSQSNQKWTNDLKETHKHIHHTAIKYFTYLVLNKRKLDNYQPPIEPPKSKTTIIKINKTHATHISHIEPTSWKEGSIPIRKLGIHMIKVKKNKLPFTLVKTKHCCHF